MAVKKSKPKKVEPAKRRNKRPKPKPVKTGNTGRPSVFSEDICEKIFSYAAVGMTENRICAAIGITEQTFNNWKRQYPGFFESLRHAKDSADEMVESALLRRAKGYSHPAVKIHFDEFGTRTESYMEHYPPSEAAAIFWLKNRQRAKWRDVSARELSGPNGGPIEGALPKIVIMLPDNGRQAVIEAPKQIDTENPEDE
jgi:hypothetical protein